MSGVGAVRRKVLFPEFSDFRGKYDAGKAQIVWTRISSDLETPVSAYLKLCGHGVYSFLLESVEGGATLGRYSIIGMQPDLLWRCRDGRVDVAHGSGEDWAASDVDALASLKEIIAESAIEGTPQDLPPMCAFGLFGYLGYDMVRLIEDIPQTKPDVLGIPDSVLMRPQVLAIFDNVKNQIVLARAVYAHAGNSRETAADVYKDACGDLEGALDKLFAPLAPELLAHGTILQTPLPVSSNTAADAYRGMVEKAVEYIRAGEIFQVVPSQRFSVPFDLPSFELYRSLRSVNPSPFLFHLAFDDFSLVGSSPEILVRVRDGEVTIRPIAGTRKRGKSAEEDKALAADLLGDPKECAEHLMLLDLGRNDVGRVAEIGSVKVTGKFEIEYYSHVMHIVSNVTGVLRKGLDIVDALFAGFPAGTVSGAPKIRAMEIIEELEVNKRSFYAGAVGYFSGQTLDSCIALRTALVKDGRVYVQAGGGVVADSTPEGEYQETCNKARAVLTAAEMAVDKYL
ncbi:MAG: anthranilate synthase component I [Alphaproteobacteria bacterium]|nr:anthranilate synthase component I [Alphaproteobacteria bacterium]